MVSIYTNHILPKVSWGILSNELNNAIPEEFKEEIGGLTHAYISSILHKNTKFHYASYIIALCVGSNHNLRKEKIATRERIFGTEHKIYKRGILMGMHNNATLTNNLVSLAAIQERDRQDGVAKWYAQNARLIYLPLTTRNIFFEYNDTKFRLTQFGLKAIIAAKRNIKKYSRAADRSFKSISPIPMSELEYLLAEAA